MTNKKLFDKWFFLLNKNEFNIEKKNSTYKIFFLFFLTIFLYIINIIFNRLIFNAYIYNYSCFLEQ